MEKTKKIVLLCPHCKKEHLPHETVCQHCQTPINTDPPAEDTYHPEPAREYLLKKGDVFGRRYLIQGKIGQGGMGQIYKARDLNLNTTIALKIIRQKYFTNKQIIKRFKNEILIARKVSHQNVIRIYDFGNINEVKFISMQYVEGINLKEVIRGQGYLKIKAASKIALQILQGLKAAHNKEVIHRDLKPQNIILDQNKQAYIVDFGLAKLASTGRSELSRPGVILGTPSYVSPEQWREEEVDWRTDIYAFGIILYEMVCGRPPFIPDSLFGYMNYHINKKPLFPRDLKQKIPSYLKKIILTCLEKKPRDRFDNIDNIILSLEKETLIQTQSFSPLKARKNPLLITAFIFTLALFLFLYNLLTREEKNPPPRQLKIEQTSILILPLKNQSSFEAANQWQNTLTFLINSDLSQSRYLKLIEEENLNRQLRIKIREKNFKELGPLIRTLHPKITYVIEGNYLLLDRRFRVNLRIYAARSGNLLLTLQEDGLGQESVYSIIDRLTRRIKPSLRLTPDEIKKDIDEKIGEITSRSPEALVYYYQAKRAFSESQFQKCVEILLKAIKTDPQFASAFYDMAEAYSYLHDIKNLKKYLTKAYQLRGHSSIKENHYITALYQVYIKKDYSKAKKTYNELLKIYPEDNYTNLMLGGIYRQHEQWEEALERYSKLDLKKNPPVLDNILYILMVRQNYNQALNLLYRYKELYTDLTQFHRYRAIIYTMQERYELAIQAVADALNIKPDNPNILLSKGQILFIKGDLPKAEELYKKIIESKTGYYKIESNFYLAGIYLQQGRYKKYHQLLKNNYAYAFKQKMVSKAIALEYYLANYYLNHRQTREAFKILDKTWHKAEKLQSPYHKKSILYYRSLAFLQNKEIIKAQNTAEQLKILLTKNSFFGPREIRDYHLLSGQVLLARNKPEQAVEMLEKALNLHTAGPGFLDSALFYHALARAYLKNKSFNKALETYQHIIKLKYGRIILGDLYTDALYQSGKLCQQKGWRGKAMENYRLFLDMLKNADPGNQKVQKARRELIKLTE